MMKLSFIVGFFECKKNNGEQLKEKRGQKEGEGRGEMGGRENMPQNGGLLRATN